jgi:iron complex outermembrane receptor protein
MRHHELPGHVLDHTATITRMVPTRRHRAMLLAMTALLPGLAHAQEASPAPQGETGASDIVVTAQRREQKLNDVGIAVSVVSAKDLRALNINNATDIVRAIPNLKYNAYGSSQVVFNIRGVSQNDYGDQQEPPVAVYQDDSYAASITTAGFPIFDLARTEALRGPQGTLFGRNATGGAVQFISNQPTHQFGGYASATTGSFNQSVFEGAINGGLTDTLAARISGIYDRDSGYIKNLLPGGADLGANNHWATRGILQWDPGSDFHARLTVRYARADRERQAGVYTLTPACPNAQFQGELLPANQVCDYWNNYGGVSYNNGVPGSVANGYANPAIAASQGGNPWRTYSAGENYVDRKQFAATLRLEGKVGAFDVTSITDYQNLAKFYIESDDGVPGLPYVEGAALPPFTTGPCASAPTITCYASGTIFYQRARTQQITQELRAAANLGANYLTFGAFGMLLTGNYGAKYATPFDQYDPTVRFYQRTRSFAVFAQDEYKFDDHWKLIVGARYWRDSKLAWYTAKEAISGLSVNWGPSGINFFDPTGAADAAGITVTPSAAKPTYDGVTARAELDYKPGPDTLIYASYNRGSKSGGFTFSTGTPFPGQALIDTLNNIPYRPETLNDYELGLKTKIGRDVQLNLAAFYYDYKNYQAYVQVGYTQLVRNLPATIKGIEAELTAHPIEGFTLQGSAAVQDSKVKNVLLPDGATLVNHDLPQAPGFSGNALVRYEFGVGGARVSLQGDALYTGKFCFSVLCAPDERQGAYHVENARIGVIPAGGKLELAFFVNNLFNRVYRSYAFDGSLYWGDALSVYGKPRTWGLTARMNFGS